MLSSLGAPLWSEIPGSAGQSSWRTAQSPCCWQDRAQLHSVWDCDSHRDKAVHTILGQSPLYLCAHSTPGQPGLSLWAVPAVTNLAAWFFYRN